MLRFLVRRLFGALVVLWIVTVVVFLSLYFIPGDPISMLVPADAAGGLSSDFYAQLQQEYGLDKPLFVQYADFIKGLLRFDLGTSLRSNRPISGEILSRYPATVILTAASLGVSLIIAIPLGVISAFRHGSWFDRFIMSSVLVGGSIPEFVVGLLLMLVFSLRLRWLPPSGYGTWRHLVLPALSLGLISSTLFVRLIRSSLLDVMFSDYIRTARSKGLSEMAVRYRHALRNALIPFVTVFGIRLGYLMGGTVIIETVFSWPGIGRYLIESILNRDIFAVRSIALVIAISFVLINVVVDLSYSYLNPQIRAG